jgi:hypothetical protein
MRFNEPLPLTAEALIDFIKDRGGVSFAELINYFKDAKGDCQLTLPGNVVLWQDISEDLAKLIIRLVQARQILPCPTTVLVYFIDGCVLKMPIASGRKMAYKKPRWLPITFNTPERLSAKQKRFWGINLAAATSSRTV